MLRMESVEFRNSMANWGMDEWMRTSRTATVFIVHKIKTNIIAIRHSPFLGRSPFRWCGRPILILNELALAGSWMAHLIMSRWVEGIPLENANTANVWKWERQIRKSFQLRARSECEGKTEGACLYFALNFHFNYYYYHDSSVQISQILLKLKWNIQTNILTIQWSIVVERSWVINSHLLRFHSVHGTGHTVTVCM